MVYLFTQKLGPPLPQPPPTHIFRPAVFFPSPNFISKWSHCHLPTRLFMLVSFVLAAICIQTQRVRFKKKTNSSYSQWHCYNREALLSHIPWQRLEITAKKKRQKLTVKQNADKLKMNWQQLRGICSSAAFLLLLGTVGRRDEWWKVSNHCQAERWGGQSMELHEINDTHLKTARWAERINTTHTQRQTQGWWGDG